MVYMDIYYLALRFRFYLSRHTSLQQLRNNDSLETRVDDEFMPDQIDVNTIKDIGPYADMIRPSKDHSTFTQDVRIKEDVNRINQIIKKII